MAVDELSVLREHLGRYRGVTLQTLEMTPEEKLGWRPAEGLKTFGEQFLHIAQTEEFYRRGFFEKQWEQSAFSPSGETQTPAGLKQRLEGSRDALRENLSKLSPADLDAVVQVPEIPVEWPLRSWLWYLVEHELHHKALLSLYLRLNGIVPPFFAYVLPPGMRPDIRD